MDQICRTETFYDTIPILGYNSNIMQQCIKLSPNSDTIYAHLYIHTQRDGIINSVILHL